jgi:putative lipoic acid-binding regulatory protein
MTQKQDESPLKFPCEFPIKVMGREEADFDAHVRGIVDQNVAPPDLLDFRRRESKNDRFVSITVTIQARSRVQLDTLYRELSGDPRILFVL